MLVFYNIQISTLLLSTIHCYFVLHVLTKRLHLRKDGNVMLMLFLVPSRFNFKSVRHNLFNSGLLSVCNISSVFTYISLHFQSLLSTSSEKLFIVTLLATRRVSLINLCTAWASIVLIMYNTWYIAAR